MDNEELSTRNAARAACTHFVKQGIEPTVRLIRDHLGYGSNTTISNELNAWRKKFWADAALAANSAPTHWTPEQVELFDRFFLEARRTERQSFNADRTQLQAEVAQANQEAQVARAGREEAIALASNESALRNAATEQIRTLESSLAHEREELTDTRQSRDRLQSELDEVRTRLNNEVEASRQCETALRTEMQEALAQASEAKEQAIAAIKEESGLREALAYERLEGLRVQLIEETDRQRQEFVQEKSKLQAELAEAKKGFDAKEQEHRLRLVAAERKVAEAAGEVRAMEKMQAQLLGELAQLRAQVEQLRTRLTQQQSDAVSRSGEEKLEHEAAALELITKLRQNEVPEIDILAALQDELNLTLEEAQNLLRRSNSGPLNP